MRDGAVLLEPLDAPADLSLSTKSCPELGEDLHIPLFVDGQSPFVIVLEPEWPDDAMC